VREKLLKEAKESKRKRQELRVKEGKRKG